MSGGNRVTCRSCGGSNDAGQRFCGACGQPLTIACPSCGEANAASYRFCGGCGKQLDTGPAAREPGSDAIEERRWVTVLFGDLSGFTQLSEHMDPEDVRTFVDGCMVMLGEIANRFEGRVERVSGDEIMVVFGAPVSHEDDPERAVRTALEMQRVSAEHTADFGRLPMRIGINTGEMMFAPVGPEGARQHTVMGDAVNTASRLETAAPLNGVLVGQATYEATKHAIRYEAVEPIVAKGKDEPVPAWIALEAATEPAARPMSEVPIIGRERELGILTKTWESTVAERRPHLVTVIGPPGIGKSKLAREFAATLDGATAVWGRSLPYGERAGGAFGNILRQLVGAFVTDDTEVTREKVAVAVRNITGEDDDELVDRLSAFMGASSANQMERTELFGAARQLIESLAAEGPILVVFEDMQWADMSHLELIVWLVTRTQSPVFFLTLTRPELLEVNPTWGGGIPAYTALQLGPLDDDCVRNLAHALRGDLDAGTLLRIERAAGGNPLFVEELSAWLSEGDDTTPLPASVTSIVASRLDGLPPKLRRVILDASVIGASFWRGSLEALGTPDVDEALDELVVRDLIRREPASRVPGDDQYAFRHQVIHDVAYEILPRAIRKQRHEQAAHYIEGRVANTELVAGVLANHWRQAGDNGRAVDYLMQAAEVAGRGWEHREALDLYKEASRLLDPADKVRKRKLNLQAAVARQRYVHVVLDRAQLLQEAASDAGEKHPHDH